MTIYRPCVWILGLIATIAVASSVQAQRIERFSDHDVIAQPFGDWTFDYDWQPFSPVIDYEYGNEPLEGKYGWFFTYDRLYWNVTRSENAPAEFDGDFSWGNKFDLGYMTEDDHGWYFSAQYLKGPNIDVLNKVHYASVELNKTWRLEPFYHGIYAEPFVGVRYVKIDDYFNGYVENNMIGGQLGARVFKQIQNFVISGEFRAYAAHNYQFYEAQVPELLLHEFVIGGETRAEVAYLITRDVAIRFAWDAVFFGQGIGRGSDPAINDEAMFLTGLNFGFAWKR
jgi:hypothetical protein